MVKWFFAFTLLIAHSSYASSDIELSPVGGVRWVNPDGTSIGRLKLQNGQLVPTIPLLTQPVIVQTLSSGTLQLQSGYAYDLTLTGPVTISLVSPATGTLNSITIVVHQGNSGGYALTLPTGVVWPGGITPTPNLLTTKIDVFTFRTVSGGAIWLGGS